MSYEVKPANVFSRLGQGFGSGLAEQIPKEIERTRLSEGLRKLGEQKDLDPFQQYAGLAAIPGMNPSILQGAAELLKYRSIRDAYQKQAGGGSQPLGEKRGLDPVDRMKAEDLRNGPNISDVGFAQKSSPRSERDFLLERNPLSSELTPRKPWTQERKNQELAKLISQFPHESIQTLNQRADEAEQRELAQPLAEQAIDSRLKEIEAEAEGLFDKFLSTKLQKSGSDTYQDVLGQEQINLKKGLFKDLKDNPQMSAKEAVDKWTELGLNLAKDKNQFNTLAGQNIFQNSPSVVKDKLKSFRKTMVPSGNAENFRDMIVEKFNLSPQRASQLAFDESKSVKNFLKNYKFPSGLLDSYRKSSISRGAANQLKKVITEEDSLLSIARALKDKAGRYGTFNESDFFNAIREDEDFPLNARQRRELNSGEQSNIPTWGDIWLF